MIVLDNIDRGKRIMVYELVTFNSRNKVDADKGLEGIRERIKKE